jgi:hypothetical protein
VSRIIHDSKGKVAGSTVDTSLRLGLASLVVGEPRAKGLGVEALLAAPLEGIEPGLVAVPVADEVGFAWEMKEREQEERDRGQRRKMRKSEETNQSRREP